MKVKGTSRQEDVLQTAFDVSACLIQEKDLATLLQHVCDLLVQEKEKENVYSQALVVLVDEAVGGVAAAEAGFGAHFDHIMQTFRAGNLPSCLQRTPGEPELCTLCSQKCVICCSNPHIDISVSFRCNGTVVGCIVLKMPPMADGEKPLAQEDVEGEFEVLGKLALLLGKGLDRCFLEENLQEKIREFTRIEQRYELALSASQVELWDWDLITREMYVSPGQRGTLDYKQVDNFEVMAAMDEAIHPDDKDGLIRHLSDHLAGKTSEYRMEYRIKGPENTWEWFLDRGQVVERDAAQMPTRMTGTHQNITAQKEKDQALAQAREELHLAVEHERAFVQAVINGAGDPVVAIDLDYNLLLVNTTAARYMGTDPVHALGQKCYRMFHGADIPCDDPAFPCPVKKMAMDHEAATLIHEQFHGNGINNTFELEVSPLYNFEDELIGIIEVARDITDRLRIEQELRQSQQALYSLAHHDNLTGLPNRLLFRDRLQQAVMKALRYDSAVAVLFVDLDGFKQVNDTLGHDVGDDLLKVVARELNRLCRQSDTVARWGGDEFVFLLETIAQKEDAEIVAKKIVATLSQPLDVGRHEITISTSVGIAFYPFDHDSIDEVIKYADLALYQAKQNGKNGYSFFHPDLLTP